MLLHLHQMVYPPQAQANSLQSPLSTSLINKLQKRSTTTFVNNEVSKKRRNTNSCIVSASSESESESEFEVDTYKAREALRQLDEQFQSLATKKQLDSIKIRPVSDLNLAEEPRMREEVPEISGSFLTNTSIVLVLFTIFYNILFIAVIKPAIDGSDEPDMSYVNKAQEAATFRQPTSSMPQGIVKP